MVSASLSYMVTETVATEDSGWPVFGDVTAPSEVMAPPAGEAERSEDTRAPRYEFAPFEHQWARNWPTWYRCGRPAEADSGSDPGTESPTESPSTG